MYEFEWIEFDSTDKKTFPDHNKDFIFLFKGNPTIVCHGCYFNYTGYEEFILFRFDHRFKVIDTIINPEKIKCYSYITIGHYIKYIGGKK